MGRRFLAATLEFIEGDVQLMIRSHAATPALVVLSFLTVGSAQCDEVIWDNGDWSYIYLNGYSSIGNEELDRRILSDITFDRGRKLTGFELDGIWATAETLIGTGTRLWLRSDDHGAPGDVITEMTTGNYTEVDTGDTAFFRPIVRANVDITGGEYVTAGTYWLEMQMQGPTNFWQLTSYHADNLIGEQTWVNYTKIGGLQPAENIFGRQAEVNFKLYGMIPAPGVLSLFALMALQARSRHRS